MSVHRSLSLLAMMFIMASLFGASIAIEEDPPTEPPPATFCNGCIISPEQDGSIQCDIKQSVLPGPDPKVCAVDVRVVLGSPATNCKDTPSDCNNAVCSLQWKLEARASDYGGCDLTFFKIQTSSGGSWQALSPNLYSAGDYDGDPYGFRALYPPSGSDEWAHVLGRCGTETKKYFRVAWELQGQSYYAHCESNLIEFGMDCTACTSGVNPH